MTHRNLLFVGLGIVLSIMSGRVYAQLTGAIRGLVTDKDFNDEPLGGVKVMIVQTEQSVISDDQGGYLLSDVAPGTYTLVFSKDDFVQQIKTEVLVSAGQLTEVNASMPGEFTEMDEFIVQELKLDTTSEIGLIELRGSVPQFMDSVGEQQLSAAGVSDAAGALSLVSGATVADGKPVVRGLPDRYVNSQVNFVRFPSADRETRSLELDQFPTDVIESIQVSKTFTPDQQADASGGAVNIVLKGIPDQDVFKTSVGTGYNTNLNSGGFRSYGGGGLDFFGVDRSRTTLPPFNPSPVALGSSPESTPLDYSFDMTLAKRFETPESEWTFGGVVNLFYGHGGSFYDDGVDAEYLAQYVIDRPFSAPTDRTLLFLPDTSEALTRPNGNPLEANVFDVTKSTEEVQWGGLFATGAENENNRINFVYLETNTIEDTTVVATDTRTRTIVRDALYDLDAEILASGAPLAAFDSQFNNLHDPANDPIPTTGQSLAFARNQTIVRRERTIRSAQLRGEHKLPIYDEVSLNDDESFRLKAPEIEWIYAFSSSSRSEPDKRVFSDFLSGSGLAVSDPARTAVADNIPTIGVTGVTSGYAQRIWEDIREDSYQTHLNLKLPFVLPNNEEGYLKAGVFRDRVTREFARETYVTDGTNPTASITSALSPGTEYTDFFLSDTLNDSQRSNFTTDNASDVDYDGNYDLDAYFLMLDVPVTPIVRLVGGFRVETTKIGIGLIDSSIDQFARGVNSSTNFTTSALWTNFAGGVRTINGTTGLPLGDVDYSQTDVLPSISLIVEPTEKLSFRAAYSQTIARPTFRELTVVRDLEFLGSTPFFGNDSLQLSSLNNYDFRADYRPTPGGLISFSLFYKEITDPIEYISITGDSIQPGTYIVPINFPDGTILGGELEIRQDIGELYPELTGLSIGANGTIIESEVSIPTAQQTAPLGESSRPMLNAPEMLLNLFAVYRNVDTGTELGLFYTVRGDTLVAGASATPTSTGNFAPNVFETEFDTLNFTFAQKLGEHLKFKFSAKNLTDPSIQRVYRSSITPETVQSSYSKGISLSVSLSASFDF